MNIRRVTFYMLMGILWGKLFHYWKIMWMQFIGLLKWMEYVINGNPQDRTTVALMIPFRSSIMKQQYLLIRLEQLPFTRFFCGIYSHDMCNGCCVIFIIEKRYYPKEMYSLLVCVVDLELSYSHFSYHFKI